MKGKGGWLLILAVAVMVVAGCLMPGILLKEDVSPSLDLGRYQTVEISYTGSASYIKRLQVAASVEEKVSAMDITGQYTDSQLQEMTRSFLEQLRELETAGVIPQGVTQMCREEEFNTYVLYYYDVPTNLGIQLAVTYQAYDRKDTWQMGVGGAVDMGSGKITQLQFWQEDNQDVSADRSQIAEKISGYANYLNLELRTEPSLWHPDTDDCMYYVTLGVPGESGETVGLTAAFYPVTWEFSLQRG